MSRQIISSKRSSDKPTPVLAASEKCKFSLLICGRSNLKVRALADTYGIVCLITASYTMEAGLREGLQEHDAYHLITDSPSIVGILLDLSCVRVSISLRSCLIVCVHRCTIFTCRHPTSSSSLHLLRHSRSIPSQPFDMGGKYRNSHNIVYSRLTLQLTAQPTCRLPGLFIEGGVYVEILHSLLHLTLNPVDGFANSAALVDPTSTIPLTHVANYDTAANWAPRNPEKRWVKYPNTVAVSMIFP